MERAMTLQISEAERERRELVAKLRGRLFPAVPLPHNIVYAHGDKTTRPPTVRLSAAERMPLPPYAQRPTVVNPERTVLKIAPTR
jgi:hypothetical protein